MDLHEYLKNENEKNKVDYDKQLEEYNQNVKKQQKVIEKDDEDEKAYEKGKKIVIGTTITGLIIIMLVAGGIAYKKWYKSAKKELDNLNNDKTTSMSADATTDPVMVPTSESPSEATTSSNTDAMQELNISDETEINELANKITSEIQNIQASDSNYAQNIDQNKIVELIKYVRHDQKGYTGTYSITNENAYGDLAELTKNNQFDAGELFTGLDSYDGIESLSSTIKNVSDNDSYDDEYQAYKTIDNLINNQMNYSDYPQVITTIAILDNNIDTPNMQFMRNGAKENGQEGTDYYNEKNSIDQNQRMECKNIYAEIDRNSSSYAFNDAVDKALEEDKHIDEYNKNRTQTTDDTNASKTADYSCCDTFYNEIEKNRQTFGSAFANEFTSVDDVKSLYGYINMFDDIEANEFNTTINSRQTYEDLIDSYYQACAIYGVEPKLNILFSNNSYAQGKMKEAENLANDLKNGKGTDYSIANNYYTWYGVNLCDMDTAINASQKENAPLIDALIRQFYEYRGVGNMLAARKYQKTYALNINNKEEWACPDAIDNTIINQGVNYEDNNNPTPTYGTVFDYMDQMNSRTR